LKAFFAAATSARKNGFARAPSSAVKGVTDLSAPIIRGDRAAAALTVPYIKTTNSQGSVHTVIEKIQAVANAITAQLSEGDSRA
jgi:DNA-binding IclR family transcriptional regulator